MNDERYTVGFFPSRGVITVAILIALLCILIPVSNTLDKSIEQLDNLNKYGNHYQGITTISVNQYQEIIEGIERGKPPTPLSSSDNQVTIYYDFKTFTDFPYLAQVHKGDDK